MLDRCKTPTPKFLDWCKTVRSQFEYETAIFNKMCRDNEVPRGNYGCPELCLGRYPLAVSSQYRA
jgi:hypothetical protein